ncbi:MAG: gliding motility lipoprotein GldD [Bacteroidales bacterium]|nr:gliding motility lipoprotein GldD [Bacteroidales bacterium]
MRYYVLLLVCLIALWACDRHSTPKPRGFFRIALPEKAYQATGEYYPYWFEYPVYAEFVPDTRSWAEDYWADLVFEEFNARIHLSYKPISSDDELRAYVEDARTFVHKHIPKATGIRDEVFVHEEHQVYGMLYRIRGREVASALQFYATDSTSHFLRGALYFNLTPNNDSLAPVIDFIEEDIRHLLWSLRW